MDNRAETNSELVPETMDAFLQSVEKKAYRMALLAVSNHSDAIDLIQDSMLKLVVKYEDRPANEWKPLFYKILQNKIRDWHRHQKLKNVLFFWKSADPEEQDDDWPPPQNEGWQEPEKDLVKTQMQSEVLEVLHALPEKQQQCFLLRSWEGLSVLETAEIMGCSEGSVKTHYFRAVTKLRELLGEKHDVKI